jgi:hypothetical protein
MSHGGSEFEQVVELVFQNVQYLLTVALAPGDTLCVEAEHKTDGSRWRGDFTSRCESSSSSLHHQLVSFSVVVTITSLCKDWDDFEKDFPSHNEPPVHDLQTSGGVCNMRCSVPPPNAHRTLGLLTQVIRSLSPPPFFFADIEEITRKTGNFKTFTVFVKMLRSAILQESDSVFVDLLTYQDLEMLKNKFVPSRTRKIIVHYFPTFLPCSAHEMCSCDLNIAFHLSYVIYFQ